MTQLAVGSALLRQLAPMGAERRQERSQTGASFEAGKRGLAPWAPVKPCAKTDAATLPVSQQPRRSVAQDAETCVTDRLGAAASVRYRRLVRPLQLLGS